MNNKFVSYLNTLHSTDANNKGALAEAQAKEPLFAQLQVDHPWAEDIFRTLTSPTGKSVILSGHAGDGKSTIAIEVLRKLHHIGKSQLLDGGLKKIDVVNHASGEITVVKDLSECSDADRDAIFAAMDEGKRFLLISNTGTLLDFFKAHQAQIGKSCVEIENDVLTALDSSMKQSLALGPGLDVYNLSQYDNISLGLQLLERIVDSPEWDSCSACPSREVCPVLLNRNLVRNHFGLVKERIGLLYLRTYAYGNRLTMRQISAHFAYIMTAGLNCSSIQQDHITGSLRQIEKYLFVNTFWGDNGNADNAAAKQITAIRVFESQHLNSNYSPTLESSFWDNVDEATFLSGVHELPRLPHRLLIAAKNNSKPKDAAYARRMWRRLVYFLGNSSASSEMPFDSFLSAFLNSPMILKYVGWQKDAATFKAKALLPSLFSVLQEEFCGFAPPEGSLQAKTLFITLRRKNADVRQSAQLVLRRVNFQEFFKLALDENEENIPVLIGKNALSSIRLVLSLPFLDYIVSRKMGEIGRGLSLSYRDRLEKLMAQIVYNLPEDNSEELIILKRHEDGSLSTINVGMTSDGLEVTND